MRFDSNTTVEGYDPDQYLRMYENAEGDTWREKLNAMRQEEYILEKLSENSSNHSTIHNESIRFWSEK